MKDNFKFYTYILSCDDGSFYTGITSDVERRFCEHYFKEKTCAKYTKSHQVQRIEAVFESETKSAASKLEYHIKHLSKSKKIDIVNSKKDLTFGNIVFHCLPVPSTKKIIEKYNKK